MKSHLVSRQLAKSALALILGLQAVETLANIEQPDAVDMVSLSKDASAVNLGLVQQNPWNNRTLTLLDRKLKTYESFVKDGELQRRFPQVAGKPVVVEVAYFAEPDTATLTTLQAHAARLEAASIKLRWFKLSAPK